MCDYIMNSKSFNLLILIRNVENFSFVNQNYKGIKYIFRLAKCTDKYRSFQTDRRGYRAPF